MTDLRRLMGIDHGERRIGVALTDPLCLFASPHSIIEVAAPENTLEILADLVSQQAVAKVIVGLPTATDGGVGKQGAVVIRWARTLKERLSIPIILWDESYTSEDAGELAGQRIRRGEPIDDIAAALILQDYLGARGAGNHEPGQPLETFNDIE